MDCDDVSKWFSKLKISKNLENNELDLESSSPFQDFNFNLADYCRPITQNVDPFDKYYLEQQNKQISEIKILEFIFQQRDKMDYLSFSKSKWMKLLSPNFSSQQYFIANDPICQCIKECQVEQIRKCKEFALSYFYQNEGIEMDCINIVTMVSFKDNKFYFDNENGMIVKLYLRLLYASKPITYPIKSIAMIRIDDHHVMIKLRSVGHKASFIYSLQLKEILDVLNRSYKSCFNNGIILNALFEENYDIARIDKSTQDCVYLTVLKTNKSFDQIPDQTNLAKICELNLATREVKKISPIAPHWTIITIFQTLCFYYKTEKNIYIHEFYNRKFLIMLDIYNEIKIFENHEICFLQCINFDKNEYYYKIITRKDWESRNINPIPEITMIVNSKFKLEILNDRYFVFKFYDLSKCIYDILNYDSEKQQFSIIRTFDIKFNLVENFGLVSIQNFQSVCIDLF